jgi:hypothetical protein
VILFQVEQPIAPFGRSMGFAGLALERLNLSGDYRSSYSSFCFCVCLSLRLAIQAPPTPSLSNTQRCPARFPSSSLYRFPSRLFVRFTHTQKTNISDANFPQLRLSLCSAGHSFPDTFPRAEKPESHLNQPKVGAQMSRKNTKCYVQTGSEMHRNDLLQRAKFKRRSFVRQRISSRSS